MSSVVFDPAVFKQRYPEFGTIPDATLDLYFAEAQIYLDNTGCSEVKNLNTRRLLLWMVTAHIAALNSGVNGQPPSGLVGRVSNATEGSVSVGAEYNVPGTAAWFSQTQYGASYWEASKRFRLFRYYPGRSCPPRTLNRYGR